MKAKGLPILEKLKIIDKKNLKVKKLSGGEQQRVAIARALINEPDVIIADEPTAHLDRKLAQEFLDILTILRAEGKTVVIATHDPFISEHELVGKTVFMRDGHLEKNSDTASGYNWPACRLGHYITDGVVCSDYGYCYSCQMGFYQ